MAFCFYPGLVHEHVDLGKLAVERSDVPRNPFRKIA
jgi:hypothetical protein